MNRGVGGDEWSAHSQITGHRRGVPRGAVPRSRVVANRPHPPMRVALSGPVKPVDQSPLQRISPPDSFGSFRT